LKRILYIPFDHLHRNYGVLKTASAESDLIVFVESARMTTGRPWHPMRLHFLISSARHSAAALRDEGFQVEYIKAATTIDGLKEVQSQHGTLPITCAEPSSFTQSKALSEFGVEFAPNDLFLTPRDLFKQWAQKQKTFVMENFYRAQRIRLGVLVDGKDPVGGEWNFDKENRLPPPKNYTWPEYLDFAPDAIDLEVAAELGMETPTQWATSREGALRALENFIENHFAEFGPYEDAMPSDNWALHHSLLSPYINNGLLHPAEVVKAALAKFATGAIPIASCEGFIRQVIGWREYVNGMYWFLGDGYRENNQLGASRPLLPLFSDPNKTSMNCVKSIVTDVKERAWVHHIPRLMVLSNLALITGSNPQEFLDWMREQFVDASEWVMVPNVIGMGLHADGGQMMTKPYAAGGAYISRMSTYCKECSYNPKLRVGDNACPFTTLYWDFLDRHREEFVKNHRMSQQVFGLNRLSDLGELKERARDVLEGLDRGVI
jgi:deoxyribodipyrimidine photolyase-related protein